MDSPFAYSQSVVGSDFLSRKNEMESLSNLIREKHHAVIYEAPKTGKRSLVLHTLQLLQKQSYPHSVCELNLFNIRSTGGFLREFTGKLAACVPNSIYDRKSFSQKYFGGYDPDSETTLTNVQMSDILNATERVCQDFSTNVIVYIEDFQNILLFDDGDSLLKLLEKVWTSQKMTSYIITGSRINAMKYIFEEVRDFYHFAEHIKFTPLDEKVISDQIIKTFLTVGRVVNSEQAAYIYRTLKGHPWYIWHLSNICFNLTKGYLNDNIISDGMKVLMSTHETLFQNIVNDLSNYQLSYLRAVNDGVVRFSSKDIIREYGLNSSANAHRLKEALMKKEVISFDEKDEPYIIDPLFKIWLNQMFKIRSLHF